MEFRDYYETLGVARDAAADDIKSAYRTLALKWHPDRHPDDKKAEAEERFKQVSEAYEVLSDADKRAKYDRFGQHWEHGQEFQPPEGGADPEQFREAFGGGFSDFFASMFGGDVLRGAGRRGARHARFDHKGADVRAELRLAVGDAVRGGRQSFELMASVTCSHCGGVGFVGEHVCPACAGVGAVRRRKTVTVTLPVSVRNGMTMRLQGLGEAGGSQGEPGDLYITLRFEPDDVYRCVGHDLECDVPIAPWEALDGTKVDVRTPDGTVVVTVPAGTRAGTKLRLRGRGLDDGQGGRGDMHAVVRLALPDDLTERQRALLREARSAGPASVSGGARGEVR